MTFSLISRPGDRLTRSAFPFFSQATEARAPRSCQSPGARRTAAQAAPASQRPEGGSTRHRHLPDCTPGHATNYTTSRPTPLKPQPQARSQRHRHLGECGPKPEASAIGTWENAARSQKPAPSPLDRLGADRRQTPEASAIGTWENAAPSRKPAPSAPGRNRPKRHAEPLGATLGPQRPTEARAIGTWRNAARRQSRTRSTPGGRADGQGQTVSRSGRGGVFSASSVRELASLEPLRASPKKTIRRSGPAPGRAGAGGAFRPYGLIESLRCGRRAAKEAVHSRRPPSVVRFARSRAPLPARLAAAVVARFARALSSAAPSPSTPGRPPVRRRPLRRFSRCARRLRVPRRPGGRPASYPQPQPQTAEERPSRRPSLVASRPRSRPLCALKVAPDRGEPARLNSRCAADFTAP